MQGEFERAWPDFEWRKRKPGHNLQIPSAQPIWSGLEDISDKTILVHWEQGLGDTIQFCRYVTLLSKIAGKVLFWPQKNLMALMQRANLGAEIVDFDDKSLQYDFRIPLMSLPVVMKTNFNNIPKHSRYISPDPERVTHWQKTLSPDGFKIGISWKGSSGPIDAGRSVPLTAFLPLLQIPGVRLISLQKFEGLLELYNLPKGTRIETLGDDFDQGPNGFSDTAAVMGLCDLVITSDTATAHLAGALGVPTWVALRHLPDWRWFLDREDRPWYDSVRLFRQRTPGDWDGVFADILQAARQVMAGAPVVSVPQMQDNPVDGPPPDTAHPLQFENEKVDTTTCLSCNSKHFGGEQAFTYNQTELGQFYRDYQRLMDHWRSVLPASHFLEVDYESVVEDIETEARRILAFLDLPWNAACLDFHATERPIRTASVNQVRKPIYKTSSGRWHKHAKNLRPLLDALRVTPPSSKI